jgi:hypothetical protein
MIKREWLTEAERDVLHRALDRYYDVQCDVIEKAHADADVATARWRAFVASDLLDAIRD